MKIIKPGVNPSTRTYTFNCRNCDGIYQEVRSKCNFHDSGHQRDSAGVSINCPCCNNVLYKSVHEFDKQVLGVNELY